MEVPFFMSASVKIQTVLTLDKQIIEKHSFLLFDTFLNKWPLSALFLGPIGCGLYHLDLSRGPTERAKSQDL